MLRAEDQDLGVGMSRRIKQLKTGIDRRMRALIDDGVADGSIRPCDTRMTAFALAGALNWMGHWYREDASLKPAQIADKFIDVFNRGLRGRD
jgi:hypothetical protein